MAVLTCDNCGCKVESNRCHDEPMTVNGNMLACETCGKQVEINHCCGNPMHEKTEMEDEE
ncbi:MAG TPA: hypothetical protein VFF13_05675 [archaeon]|nr:hypothetical protein [archaeon]